MTVGILLITHNELGMALINTVTRTLGILPLPIQAVAIDSIDNGDPDYVLCELQKYIRQLDQGDGVLILTDIFGATPNNIARKLEDSDHIVIAGLNLPMLIRVMNYPHLSLLELAQKAFSGGREGVCSSSGNRVTT